MLTSWKTHYLSWKQVQNNYLLIKYENLINKPDQEFRKISNFFSKLLNKKFSEIKIQNSIESNTFDNLKKHLAQDKNLSKLFDNKTFTKDLEKIYKKIIN